MKNNSGLSWLFIGSLLITACHSQNVINERADKDESADESVVAHWVAGELITINNQKFNLVSPLFGKGAKVYNTAIKEYGYIKGTIVVVTDTPPPADSNKITLNTYRVWPHEGQSLQQLYFKLLNDLKYQTVELEVDYSAESPTLSFN